MARLALLAALISFFLAGCGKSETREERSQSAPIENFGFTNVARNAPPVASGEAIAGEQARIAPGSVMRFTIQWRLVQRTPDARFDWALYDRHIVQPALAQGLRPLIVVAAAPEWAWGDGVCSPENLVARGYCYMPPGDDRRSLTAWGDWVASVAKRYGGDAVAIEVWNEPNGGGFWNTTERPDPEHYARVLCEAYDAVSAVNPDLPVVSGGLATSFDTDARHVSAGEFLAGVYEAMGSQRCMDGIGIHPYPRQQPPDSPTSAFQQRLREVRAVRDQQDEAPLWITEFGYYTRGQGAVSEEVQAEGIECALAVAGTMPDVNAFIVHTLLDRGTLQIPEGSFGVLNDPPGQSPPTPKTAASSLAQALETGTATC